MRSTLLTALLLTTAACGPTIMIDRDESAPIAAGSGWAFGRPDSDGLAPDEGAVVPADSIHMMILAAIEAELVAKGFPKVAPESARLVVHYHVGQRTVRDTLPPPGAPRGDDGVRAAPGSWGAYGRPESVDDRTIEWEEGMLVIDAVTRPQGVVAWRGLIAGEIREEAGRHPEPGIRDAVRRLVRRFP